MFDRDLIKDVAGDTSGDYRALLLGLLECDRETGVARSERAVALAHELYAHGEGRIGTNEATVREEKKGKSGQSGEKRRKNREKVEKGVI